MALRLSPEAVQKISDLARLKLTPAEVERFSQQLSEILDYVSSLGQVSVAAAGTDTAARPAGKLRSDEIHEFPARADLMAGDNFRQRYLRTKNIF